MGHVERMGGKIIAYKLLTWKPEGKTSLRKSRRGCEDSSKIYLKYIRWEMCTGFIWLRIGASG
jgi:hypothetical protein